MSEDTKKVNITVLVAPEVKARIGLAALMSGRRALTAEAEARLVASLDADGIPVPTTMAATQTVPGDISEQLIGEVPA